MKVEWLGVHFHNERGFKMLLFKGAEAYPHKYVFNIKAFGRDFDWGFDKYEEF